MITGDELCISIAEMPVTLVLRDLDEFARGQIAERYAAFSVQENPPTFRLELYAEPGPPFIPFQNGATWQIRTTLRGNRIQFYSHLEAGWVDRTTGQGSLTMRPEGNPENFLRLIYGLLCLENKGILLHAAGVVREGQGYVFFGSSGSGKTTISRLSLDHTVLSDDLVILKRYKDIVRVYGVPFRGDLPEAPRTNLSAELCGLFTVVKDKDHHVAPVSRFEAVARLTSCVPFVMTDPGSAARVMENCTSIEDLVPVRALHFRPDADFWRVIDGEQ